MWLAAALASSSTTGATLPLITAGNSSQLLHAAAPQVAPVESPSPSKPSTGKCPFMSIVHVHRNVLRGTAVQLKPRRSALCRSSVQLPPPSSTPPISSVAAAFGELEASMAGSSWAAGPSEKLETSRPRNARPEETADGAAPKAKGGSALKQRAAMLASRSRRVERTESGEDPAVLRPPVHCQSGTS